MTITFPRSLPAFGVAEQIFDIQRNDLLSPVNGGAVGGVQQGFPRWVAQYALGDMLDSQSDVWRAWLKTMRGAQKLFYGQDQKRLNPRAGLVAGFNGTCSSWSQSINGDGSALLDLGCNSGQVISIGDYIDWRWTTSSQPRRFLCQAMEAVVSASGHAVFQIEPPIPVLASGVGLVPPAAVAHLDNPACLMRITETNMNPMDLRETVQGSFKAAQVLLP